MVDLFRSQEMGLYQVILQQEAAFNCIEELGNLSIVQFRDLNPETTASMKNFVNEIRRCTDIERSIAYIIRKLQKNNIIIKPKEMEYTPAAHPGSMHILEPKIKKLEGTLHEIEANENQLLKEQDELFDRKHVLEQAQCLIEHRPDVEGEVADLPLDAEALSESLNQVQFLTGVIARRKVAAFEKLIWRASRGTIFMRHADMAQSENQNVTDCVEKNVFVLFFQGERLKTLAKKICDGFRAKIHPCPGSAAKRRDLALDLQIRLTEMQEILKESENIKYGVLNTAAEQVEQWWVQINKMKAVFYTLNLCSQQVSHRIIAEIWCPIEYTNEMHFALERGYQNNSYRTTTAEATDQQQPTDQEEYTDQQQATNPVPLIINKLSTTETPPTYQKTTELTEGFQAIVDAYGVADYREVNPAFATTITFPFIFAVMFGDLGHGAILVLFALAMMRFSGEKGFQNKNEILQIFFGGRYIILLMGIFAMYTGLIYNELFGRPVAIFYSAWSTNISLQESVTENRTSFPLDPKDAYLNNSYFLGVDPLWNMAANRLDMVNSFKMKMSVIIGVTQMTFGVFLSLFNHCFFHHTIDIVTEFIPRLVFLSAIFVYLCALIVTKWLLFSVRPMETTVGHYGGSHCAPSLLIGLISMMMMKADRHEGFEKGVCYLNWWYKRQRQVEMGLVALAFSCVPLLLFGKPIFLWFKNRQRNRNTISTNADDETELLYEELQTDSEANKEFDFGETMVIQAIHTIEYCLGCISHTASYLRLWALSLAHSQLSEVLWKMVFRKGLKSEGWTGAVMIYAAFWAFSSMTIAVLVGMEGLSAFLHALRLHWVEFQSKFYAGTGYAFHPFTFNNVEEDFRNEHVK